MAKIEDGQPVIPPNFAGRGRPIDLSGRVFGRWTVVGFAGRKHHGLLWHCRCSCGAMRGVLSKSLLSGRSTSCGCYQAESVSKHRHTHGMTGTPEYGAWINVIQRCENPKCRTYPDYGGRGIRICAEWRESFRAFYDAVGPRPEGHSLDRIDNDGHYEPGNVRWSERSAQSRNRRACHRITHNGETLTIIEWSERFGIPPGTISARARFGLPSEEILSMKGVRKAASSNGP